MPTEQEIRKALRPVTAPEIGMSVVDLGMIREVAIEGDVVEVKMVLIAPFCPLADLITNQVRPAAAAVPGVKEVKVTLLNGPWGPSGHAAGLMVGTEHGEQVSAKRSAEGHLFRIRQQAGGRPGDRRAMYPAFHRYL